MSSKCSQDKKHIKYYEFHVEPTDLVTNTTFVEIKPKFCVPNIKPYIKEQFKIGSCLYLNFLMIGFGLGWSAPVIVKLQNIDETPLDRVITDAEASWIATIICLTNILVLLVSGYTANLLGRKPCIILSSMFMFCGYALQIVATDIKIILAGRILIGFGMALAFITTLVYMGEIASPNIRGVLVALTGVVQVLGSLLVYSVAPYVSYAAVGYIALAICFICVACGFYIPESPLHHVNKGKIEEAKSALRRLGRSEEINTELRNMISNVNMQNSAMRNGRPFKNLVEMFTEKINRKSLAISGTLFFLQEASGVVTITFFATTIFKSAKSSVDPHICTIILGVTELCGVTCTPFIIERFGRKILLFISSLGCAVTMAMLGAYFYLDFIKHPAAASMGWLPLLLLILFVLSYNSGFHIIPNTLVSEMFTPAVRSTGSSTSFICGLLSSFIINISYGYVVRLGHHVAFWAFACINMFTFLFTLVCVPETKNKSLMEIQELLKK